jgi:hypothetical protein
MVCGSCEAPDVIFGRALQCNTKAYSNAPYIVMCKYTLEFLHACTSTEAVNRRCGFRFYDTRRRSLKLRHQFASHSVHHHERITWFLIYKTNMCTSNTHSNTIYCLLLHVSATLRYLQEVYTWMFRIHHSMIHGNGNTYYIMVISAAELKNFKIS